MNLPLVSVVITTKNYGRFLPQAIESVLNQSFPKENIELVIVDDGSTDETAEIVRGYAAKNIHYIYQDNRGQAGAINTGFKAASGKFIALLDADDYFYKTKLEEVMSKFNKEPKIGMISHRLDVIDNKGNFLYTTPFRRQIEEGWVKDRIIKYGGTWNAFLFGAASSLTFHRSLLENILPIPENDFRLCADGCLVMLAALYTHVGAINKSLGISRSHGNNYWREATMTAEGAEKKLIIPMLKISKMVKKRLPERAKVVNVYDDPYFVERCVLVEKLKGRWGRALWNYLLFVRAVYRDSRIRWSYKFWRISSILFLLIIPDRIYFIFNRWYANGSALYKLRTAIFPHILKERKSIKKELIAFYSNNRAYFEMARMANIKLTEERKKLLGYIKPHDKVLDVGCGTAEIGRYISKHARYFGIDVSSVAVKMANDYKAGAFYILCADAGKTPFKDRFFDVVISTASLEHFTSLEQILNEMQRVLKPSGKLVLLCTSYDCFYSIPPSLEHLNVITKLFFILRQLLKYITVLSFKKYYFEVIKKPSALTNYYRPDNDLVCIVTTAELLNWLRRRQFNILYVRQRPTVDEKEKKSLKALIKKINVVRWFTQYWQLGAMIVAEK